ncbi:MAG TPA: M28 family peptidase [Anaerolineaceae bacterium]
MKKRTLWLILPITILALTAVAILFNLSSPRNSSPLPGMFQSSRAYQDLEYQVNLGPRVPGSKAHQQVIDWIQLELKKAGWTPEVIQDVEGGVPVRNIVGRRETTGRWIILGAHYDSRFFADQDIDPSKRNSPVLGANDGASGVAVLLEIARVLPSIPNTQIWLVFFDMEDQGSLSGYDWILGSRAFARTLPGMPDAVVVIDMIGDRGLNIYQEQNSTPALSKEIWDTAASLGYDKEFISTVKYSILDDHIPFLRKGIPAVDIIDFDYAYWHTSNDTLDKISPESLAIVGNTLVKWLVSRK